MPKKSRCGVKRRGAQKETPPKKEKAIVKTAYKTHVIRRGDTVTRICNKYNINKKTLLKANNLRSSNLKAGQRLRIPYRTTAYKLVKKSEATAGLKPAEMLPENLIIHTYTRVLHIQLYTIFLPQGSDRYATILRGRLDRIHDQVHKDLVKLTCVRLDLR